MTSNERKIRIALPSKGMLAEESKSLFAEVGLKIYSPNPRQYIATIPRLPQVEVIFQRTGDIVISVRDGSVDFGITGKDVYLEKHGPNDKIMELHSHLGFGKCSLNVIVTDDALEITKLSDLSSLQEKFARPLKIATKFPKLTMDFIKANTNLEVELIKAEGTLEIAPTIGYADLIVDLVSTGTTLRDNHLRILEGGKILEAEACLIANKNSLKSNPETRAFAVQLLELIGAHLRAKENLAIFANVRGTSPESITEKIMGKEIIRGLQGPTISKIITQENDEWCAVHLVVKKSQLHQAIQEIRQVGGSGVVVSPVTYIFEEEPEELQQMLAALEE